MKPTTVCDHLKESYRTVLYDSVIIHKVELTLNPGMKLELSIVCDYPEMIDVEKFLYFRLYETLPLCDRSE